ncbi:hypothetical protein GCM10022235_51160 [Kribbella ginsengisoli]|uniref:Uncharacterized protein n=1 Tax=Kribbella ginsengisoli TaxID=363865 RepID=A0ABP6Y1E5_9ACTN
MTVAADATPGLTITNTTATKTAAAALTSRRTNCKFMMPILTMSGPAASHPTPTLTRRRAHRRQTPIGVSTPPLRDHTRDCTLATPLVALSQFESEWDQFR